MKTILAVIGAFVLFLASLGALGFGDFVVMYSCRVNNEVFVIVMNNEGEANE